MGASFSPVIDAPVTDIPLNDCSLCPRLVGCRARRLPVTPTGPNHAGMLIVSMGPPAQDQDPRAASCFDTEAETLLYDTLSEFGFVSRALDDRGEMTLTPVGSRIICATRCPAPSGLPQPSEVLACNQFLRSELQTMPNLKVVIALGVLAHNAILAACGVPLTRISFQNGRIVTMPDGLRIASSHHLSRHNLKTGQIKRSEFRRLIADVQMELS